MTRNPRRDGRMFVLERGVANARGGSFAAGSVPFLPSCDGLWLVNHHDVTVDLREGRVTSDRRVLFDCRAAEAEIRAMSEHFSRDVASDFDAGAAAAFLAEAEAVVEEVAPPSTPVAGERAADLEVDAELQPVSGLRARRGREAAATLPSPPHGAALTQSAPRAARRPQSVTGQPLVRGSYHAMPCAGCGAALGSGWVCRTERGDAMMHNDARCAELARRQQAPTYDAPPEEVAAEAEAEDAIEIAVAAEMERMRVQDETQDAAAAAGAEAAERARVAQAVARDGSDQRRAQLASSISSRRCERVRACIEGRCGEDGTETPMVCLGTALGVAGGAPCPARLHGVRCAEITKGHASLGVFRCADCMMRSMFPASVGQADFEFPLEARLQAEHTMLLRLSSGAEATGKSYSEFKRLETEFTLGLGAVVGHAARPSDDPTVFMMFLTWLATTRERALSLHSVWRAAGAVMARTLGSDRNLTRDPEVKAYFASLCELHGEESKPRTAATRRMLRLILDELIDARFAGADVRARTKLMIALEAMLGLRVGEALSGGDFHGLAANHLCIMRNRTTGTETVEAVLEHSKTKHKRWINAVGVSQGLAQVDLARHLRAYWALAGLDIVEREEGGYHISQPDYYVLRLDLVALGPTRRESEAALQRIGDTLRVSPVKELAQWADYVALRGGQRMSSEHSKDRRYINIVGGPLRCAAIAEAARLLTVMGFGDSLSEVPGPLLRATHFKKPVRFSHMPLQPQSTYDSFHALFDTAFERLRDGGGDPELDLQGLKEPRWGHHSLRRLADTVARETMAETGVSETDIDLVFGWREAMHSHEMQVHYQSRFVRERRALVTSRM